VADESEIQQSACKGLRVIDDVKQDAADAERRDCVSECDSKDPSEATGKLGAEIGHEDKTDDKHRSRGPCVDEAAMTLLPCFAIAEECEEAADHERVGGAAGDDGAFGAR